MVLALGARGEGAGAELYGQITFTGLPVPGATVTATQGDKRVVGLSDADGVYRLADLSDGPWTIRVEMVGFSPLTRDITIPSDTPPTPWELVLLPFEEITKGLAAVAAPKGPPLPAAATPDSKGAEASSSARGFQRADVNAAVAAPTPVSAAASSTNDDGDTGLGAADGFLINGSVNNSAASPFAQARAFGNNRPGQRSLYNGGFALLSNNSMWDARPYSFTTQQAPKPSYNDVQFNATFGGPLRIPRVLKNGPNLFLAYQRTKDHSAITQPALVPTLLERSGNFSATRDGLGRPVTIVDPTTGQPFPGGIIPIERLSPQASALLGYYPQPNVDAVGGYNFQIPLVVAVSQDSAQSRVSHVLGPRDQLVGAVSYQRGTTDTANLFGFIDSTRVSNVDANINLSHRLSQFLFLRARYQLTRASTDVTPHFANRVNVSGLAGISGNNQEPVNWGPPSLTFSSALAGLSSAQYASNTNLTNGWSSEIFMTRGRHSFTFGAGIRQMHYDVFSQQDARGAFSFTGAATGSDLADFMLGIPRTSSIAFGNPDKNLRSLGYESYVNDDWRVSATLTLNLGARWEYESPITELQNRLVNLDIAPGFAAISPVLAANPRGALTGREFGNSLVHPDKNGIQPRVGLAWRPVPGSSLVIRGGYGLYRNTLVYQSIALLMAQQPPLSKSFSLENSPATPLTLANGFVGGPASTLNTFAVDPDFRVGYAENWQVSAQRDLPSSLTVIGTYLGSRGSRLMQEFLPNTYAPGAANPCPTCPSGFVYLTSGGRSLRHAGQIQVRRRLRNGFTANIQYTLAKATDNAAAFNGAGLTGTVIAQNWLDLDAELGPASFDQRHQVVAQAQYTTGAGITGGTLVDGLRGKLFKDWTVVTQLTAGSGLPLTPVYLTSVGTGFTGTVRASLTGASVDAVPDGYYLNPAAYARPAPGEWGNAGRNSVRGPAQFGLNAAVGRTFRWGNRLNLDWRFDATNVLNRVTFSGVNMLVDSPQFGLANRPNQMRKLQSSLRLRF